MNIQIEKRHKIAAFWLKLPLVVRATVGGFMVFMILQTGCYSLMMANLATTPNIPWFVPLSLLYLWAAFHFFNGRWGSAVSKLARCDSMRARRLTRQEWPLALVAAAVVVVFIISATLLLYRLIEIPIDEEFFGDLPWWTYYSAIVMVALIAGVSEEAGFRGYLQAPLEKKYGSVVAISISSVAFWLAHLNHASGMARFIPLVVMGAVLALLARSTRSIVPAIIAHASADATIFVCGSLEVGPAEIWNPVQVSETGLDTLFWADLIAVAVSSLALIWLFRRLNEMTKHSASRANHHSATTARPQ